MLGTNASAAVWLALSSWVLSVLFAAAALAITVLGLSTGAPIYQIGTAFNAVAIAIAFSTVGALVASRRPENLIGWLMCAMGLGAAMSSLSDAYASYALFASATPMSGAALAAWTSVLVGTAGMQSFPLLLLLFPDGKPPSCRWRLVVWFVVGVAVAESAVGTFGAFSSERFVGYQNLRNPFHVAALEPVQNLYVSYVQTPLLILAVLLPVIGLVARFRRSRGVERQQLKWFVSSGALAAFGVILILLGEEQSQVLLTVFFVFLTLALCGIPVSIGVAILRYRLYDVDFLINRALVYGALTACVVGVYVLIVGYLGALFSVNGNLAISLVATGLVAVLFAPLRDRLQRTVNHLMYGERDDPYAVLSSLGQRLEVTLEPGAVLQAVTETVAGALKLPHAAIELKEHDGFAASYGSPVEDPVRLPLVYGHETVGELLLAPRAGEEGFSLADRRLLGDLARQTAAAVHAVRLTADLQRARERLVTAREEERRRLRRDLHDGLGPQLSSQALTIDAARALMRQDPDAAETLLLNLKAQAQDAVADVRRLVYALRPPALDDLGLLGALRETAAQYGQNGMRVSVEAPDCLPSLPAAVEVAAYRIAQEALTNVVRHAKARGCVVALSVEYGALRLEIRDDGRGLPDARAGASARAGVGLSTMRERAAELGGSTVVETLPEGGTAVRATLPLEASGFRQQASGKSKDPKVGA